MSDPHKFTGEAVPIPTDPNEMVAQVFSGMVSTISDKVLEAKRMDQAHELTMRQAEAVAKIDRNRRIERFSWVLLVICSTAFFVGREALVKEFAGALGYVGAAAVGAIGVVIGQARKK